MFRYLRRWFIAGVLTVAPLGLTVYVTWILINFIDEMVARLLPAFLTPQHYFDFPVPGYGLLIAGVGLIIIGALTANIIGRMFVAFSAAVFNQVPFVRTVYGALRQILETILASKSDAFREVVLVEYPRRGVWVIGFVTGQTKGEVQAISKENLINVFVPTTPNPTSGFLLFVDRKDAVSLAMSVESAVKMVVSGGIVTPPTPKALRDASQAKPKSLKEATSTISRR